MLVGFILMAAVTAPLLLHLPAPYGRHVRPGWGPTVPTRLGWVLMEAPAAVVFGVCFAAGGRSSAGSLAFLILWEAHYCYRTLFFPLILRARHSRMPLVIVGCGMAFNVLNGYLNGRWLFTLGPDRGAAWLSDPRFLVGVILFAAGFAGHVDADRRLRALRPAGTTGYSVPHGGLFQWISCPNYLGEIVEWSGWALATWSLPGLAFAVWTAANLAPRARAHHRWYRDQFHEYPGRRRALLPGLW